MIASAQALVPIQVLVVSIANIVNMLIPLMIAVALVFFFWGLVTYIRNPELKTGRKIMIAGLLSLFIMVSVWGIIQLMAGALGVNKDIKGEAAPHVLP
jgi:hypothetical protein